MLQKMKRLLVVGVAALSIAFAGVQIADAHPGQHHGPPGYYEKVHGQNAGDIKYFKNGHPGHTSEWELVQPYRPGCHGACDDVIALAEAGIMIVNPHAIVDDKGMGWGTAGGQDLELSGFALATGKDKRFWFFKIPGFAISDVELKLTAKVYALVLTTGEKLDTGGLSATYVKSIGTLVFDASAWATGNDGCPQFAEVALSGRFMVTAGGYALSTGPNGSYALTQGEGTTVVGLRGSDSDFDKDGWFIFPPVAHAGIEGFVMVKQDLFVVAYVSPDGTTTFNYGVVTGGSAMALGDVDIVGIRAKGQVSQSAMATDGLGSFAYGNGTASFKGAKGDTYNGRCGSYADVGGIAVVTGYNNVTNTGNSVTATSKQHSFATTGNLGFGGGPQ